jgi:16S rRNA G527 N7-methylase RsmG
VDETTRPPLLAALTSARTLGLLGPATIERHVQHGRAFVAAIERHEGMAAPVVVDLGSGGGVPGLVVAAALPAADVHLAERRSTRADFLRRVAPSISAHITVHGLDVFEGSDDRLLPRADVVTARGFGPPWLTAEAAVRCLRPHGVLLASVVAVPDEGDDPWRAADAFGLVRLAVADGVAVWRWDGTSVGQRRRPARPHERWVSRETTIDATHAASARRVSRGTDAHPPEGA